jgi:replicative DNA helicase
MQTTGDMVLAALAPYKLKDERGGKYRCNSPFRTGSDSHSFTVMIAPDGEHGAFNDWAGGESGSLYELAEKLGIEVERQPAIETKRAYNGIAEYAQAHGVEREVYEAAGWKEVQAHDMHGNERPALAIPTATGTRYRFLDGEKPTFHTPSGTKNCWYGLTRAIALAQQRNLPLVICNGAPSVVVAQHYGVPAIAASLGSSIPDPLIEELRVKWPGELIIAMDCDNEGRQAARKIIEKLPTASNIDMRLTDRGDLADYCALYRDDTMTQLTAGAVKMPTFQQQEDLRGLEGAINALLKERRKEAREEQQNLETLLARAQAEIDQLTMKAAPARSLAFADLVSANHRALDERIRNPQEVRGLRTHITTLDKALGGWQDGRLHTIYGDTNMGKSTLAVSIISRWMAQGAGLVVCTESPPQAYLDKIVACMCRLPYDLIQEGRLDKKQYLDVMNAYAILESLQCRVMDAGSPTPAAVAAQVRDGIEKFGFKWVLIDSISKMKVPGTSDIYDTTRNVMDSLQDLCRETNLPFLLTCQVGRNLKDRANKTPMPNDALGAGTVEQNSDVIMSLYNHDHYVKLGVAQPDPELPSGTAIVRVIKHRWKDAINRAVKLVFVGGSGFFEMETKHINLESEWRDVA